MKRVIAFLLAIGMVFAVGCSSTATDGTDTENTVTIIDQTGRTVMVQQPVDRIISCCDSSTSLLLALGEADHLVGVEENVDNQLLYQKVDPNIAELTSVGSSTEIDVETCVSLSPDLVILPASFKDMTAQFDALSIPAIVINPTNFTEIETTIQLLGTAIGGEAELRAEQQLDFYHSKLEFINSLPFVGEKPTVYLAGSSDYLETITNQMLQSDMIERASATSASNDLSGDDWVEVTPEQIVQWNPDYIIMSADATYDISDIESDRRLRDVSAVKNQQIYRMPAPMEGWDCPTASAILGVLWMTNLFHDDLYPDAELQKDITYFYEIFYGITPIQMDLQYAE